MSFKNKYYTALKISLVFLLVSAAYLIFSDRITLQLLGQSVSPEVLSTVQSYKGLAFIFLTTVLIFILIQRDTISARKSIQKLKRQKRELEHQEREIEKSEKKFRAIFENSLTAIAITDDEGNYLSVNSAAAEIFGYSKKELLSMKVGDLNTSRPGDAEKTFRQYLEKQQDKGEFNFTCKDEKKRTILYHAIRIAPNFNLSVMMDISLRKEAEENLKDSKNLLEKTLNNLNEAVLMVDSDGRYIKLANKAVEKLFGYKPEELIGKKTSVLHLNQEKFKEFGNISETELEKSGVYYTRYQMKHKDGSVIETENTVSAITEEDGWKSGVISVIRNITEQKKAEEALKKSEANLRTILENAPLIIFTLDKQGKFNFTNWKGFESVSESPEDLMNNTVFDIYGQLPVILETGETISGAEVVRKVLNGEKITGKIHYGDMWLENWFVPLRDQENNILGFLGISLDITRQVEKEKEIEKYQESLKKLSLELSLAEEKQKKKIASNIHDHLSQLLVISKMKLSDVLEENLSENIKKTILQVTGNITQALENSRKITYDLSPPVLYELGLVEAMHWFTDKIHEEFDLEVEFSTEFEELILPDSKMILIYRVIQELANNVIKHAGATSMRISLQRAGKNLEIQVTDNGKGFDHIEKPATEIKDGGFGLFAVREKVQNLEGNFLIQSQPGHGTTIKIFVPLRKLSGNKDVD